MIPPRVRPLARVDYAQARADMQAFTAGRDAGTPDEIWLVEHPPVYTLGLAGRPEHLHAEAHRIPIVRTERGGQVTYHGPGQLVAYTLIDLHRRELTVRGLVNLIEAALIDCVSDFGVVGVRKEGAPGIYVADERGQPGAKIAALGLKVSRGRSYHGLSLNVDMDLSPFSAIDPCGYPGLAVTDLASEWRARAQQATINAPAADRKLPPTTEPHAGQERLTTTPGDAPAARLAPPTMSTVATALAGHLARHLALQRR